jgi:hypothetical protein
LTALGAEYDKNENIQRRIAQHTAMARLTDDLTDDYPDEIENPFERTDYTDEQRYQIERTDDSSAV